MPSWQASLPGTNIRHAFNEIMRRILHILTTPDDALARQMISAQEQQAEQTVKVVDLTVPEPDYRALLEDIFAADSIEVW